MRYLERGSFMPFVVYRVALGVVLMVLLGAGVLDPFANADA
jgi:undecaprenyl-diphosphatase